MPWNLFGISMEIPSNARTYVSSWPESNAAVARTKVPGTACYPHTFTCRCHPNNCQASANSATLKPDVRADVYRTGTGVYSHGASFKPIMPLTLRLCWAGPPTPTPPCLLPTWLVRRRASRTWLSLRFHPIRLEREHATNSLYTCNTGHRWIGAWIACVLAGQPGKNER